MKPSQTPRAAAPAQPTHGPWTTQGTGQVFDIYGNEVAHCKSYGAGIVPAGYVCPWHAADANARLIAAAPELLDVGAGLIDEIDRCGLKVSAELEAAARKALAKGGAL